MTGQKPKPTKHRRNFGCEYLFSAFYSEFGMEGGTGLRSFSVEIRPNVGGKYWTFWIAHSEKLFLRRH
jgi:hypothetical protein